MASALVGEGTMARGVGGAALPRLGSGPGAVAAWVGKSVAALMSPTAAT